MIQFIDKPIEEMTLEELQKERDLHRWFANHLMHFLRKMEYRGIKDKERREETVKEMPKDYAEQYINGIISEEEYKELKDIEAGDADESIWGDRMAYCEMVAYHHTVLADKISERINDVIAEERIEKKKKKPKERKLPKTYGYDPRRYKSRQNYPRDDWGKTRENHALHRAQKGK